MTEMMPNPSDKVAFYLGQEPDSDVRDVLQAARHALDQAMEYAPAVAIDLGHALSDLDDAIDLWDVYYPAPEVPDGAF